MIVQRRLTWGDGRGRAHIVLLDSADRGSSAGRVTVCGKTVPAYTVTNGIMGRQICAACERGRPAAVKNMEFAGKASPSGLPSGPSTGSPGVS